MDIYTVFVLTCLFLNMDVMGQTNDDLTITDKSEGHYFFSSKHLTVSMLKQRTFIVQTMYPCEDIGQQYVVTAVSSDTKVFRVSNNRTFIFECVMYDSKSVNNSVPHSAMLIQNLSTQSGDWDHLVVSSIIEGNITLTLEGNLIGISSLVLSIDKFVDVLPVSNNSNGTLSEQTRQIKHNQADDANDVSKSIYTQTFEVLVLRILRPVDRVFMVFVPVFLFTIAIGFGCKLDLEIVKECVKKPIAPGIGMCCQYVIMPLVGFTVAKLLPNINDGIAMGIFLCGICPGGGISNIYTYLLDGDVSLSITMTFLSTVASIVMMPFWLYTLGTVFTTDEFNVKIPWVNLIQIIAIVVVPLFIGIFLKYKCLKVALFIIKILKPLTLCAIIVLFVVALYSNWYLFKLFKPLHIVAGCLLPYLGYIFGGVLAALFRQPLARIKAISLETGLQNVGVALILLLTSLPPPHGDLAAVAPMASAVMTPIPPLIITILYNIYKKYCKKYKLLDMDNPEIRSDTEQVSEDCDSMELTEKLSSV